MRTRANFEHQQNQKIISTPNPIIIFVCPSTLLQSELEGPEEAYCLFNPVFAHSYQWSSLTYHTVNLLSYFSDHLKRTGVQEFIVGHGFRRKMDTVSKQNRTHPYKARPFEPTPT
jgi:hypothetical protein